MALMRGPRSLSGMSSQPSTCALQAGSRSEGSTLPPGNSIAPEKWSMAWLRLTINTSTAGTSRTSIMVEAILTGASSDIWKLRYPGQGIWRS